MKSKRNQTLILTPQDKKKYKNKILYPQKRKFVLGEIINKTINGNLFEILDLMPDNFADLIILDPPYNLDKNFNGFKFKSSSNNDYTNYLRQWFPSVIRKLKDTGSLYLCGDWKSTAALQTVMQENITVMNRITWQREKGRGAKSNWKNGMEDIWFGVKNKKNYYFDVNSVKMKRRVLAPYKINGKPKDWQETKDGNFRLTHPSNFWNDLTIPYWSMKENTDHPTQKPEKLIAKLILASCPKEGIVFDPFLGSGTTSVVAKKLSRNYVGVELNEEYALWSEKRLDLAEKIPHIQGYEDGVFWERNSKKTTK
tara:strand:+ start:4346 stop:5278 length:933 start_codon:yes stop_codon:yes gene_type:complete